MNQREKLEKPNYQHEDFYKNPTENYSGLDFLQQDLRHEIELHAESRMRFYFRFIFYISALTVKLNEKSETLLKATDFIEYKATHQWGSGHRKKDIGNQKDVHKTERQADAFKSVDAAHKFGLGIKKNLSNLVAESEDSAVMGLYKELVRIICDTRKMPQRLNVGPDKIIDELHRKRARDDLAGISTSIPIFNNHIAATYLSHASKEMEVYREKNHQINKRNKKELAEYASIYLKFYRNWSHIHRIVTSEIRIYCIDAKAYGL